MSCLGQGSQGKQSCINKCFGQKNFAIVNTVLEGHLVENLTYSTNIHKTTYLNFTIIIWVLVPFLPEFNLNVWMLCNNSPYSNNNQKCMKRLLVNFRSSLLLTIIINGQNFTTIYKRIYIKYKHIYKHLSY